MLGFDKRSKRICDQYVAARGFFKIRRIFARLTQHGTIVRVSHVDSGSNISLQPTRIVAQTAVRTRRSAIKSSDRTQVNRHVSKRTSLHKATSNPGRNRQSADSIWSHEDRAFVLDAFAVATEAGGTAVKDGRVLRRGSVFGPVPVL
jgi:hypothetical protein